MPVLQTLKSDAISSAPWRPDRASSREDIWFDHVGKFLYLDFRNTCATCIRISTWKKGLSVERWNEVLQVWQPEEWDPGIPLPLPPLWLNFPMEQFYSEFPKEAIRAVNPFKWRQFVLLRMIRHCPETLELVQSNPMLAWFCADAIAERETPEKEIRTIIVAKRRNICAFAGLPATDSMVRILGKIKPGEYTQDLFTVLRKLFNDAQKVSRLRFFKKIPVTNIGDLGRHFEFLAWALSTSDRNGVLAWDTFDIRREIGSGFSFWNDTMAMGRTIGALNILERLSHCRSYGELRSIHDKWSEILSGKRALGMVEEFFKKHGTYTFPPPPVPGNADIEPITTIKDLLAEGSNMHHCVGSYGERIMNRECYIYRVLRPQRATLEIYGTGTMHQIRQVRLVGNGDPAEETRVKVRLWLAVNQNANKT